MMPTLKTLSQGSLTQHEDSSLIDEKLMSPRLLLSLLSEPPLLLLMLIWKERK